jgi:hypothetical protein
MAQVHRNGEPAAYNTPTDLKLRLAELEKANVRLSGW